MNLNMESEGSNRWKDGYLAESLLTNFQFTKLFEIPCMNYTHIRDAVKKLEHIVVIKKFYENVHDCVKPTLHFILIYSNFMIKNVDDSLPLLSLLTLLKDVITRMNTIALQIDLVHIGDFLTLFHKIIESSHQNRIKLQVVNILTDLMKMQNIITCNKSDLLLLISSVCSWLDKRQYCFQLLCLLHTLLKRRAEIKIDMGPLIIEVLEQMCLDYLNQESDSQIVLQILKCLLVYYKTREENNYVTNTLKRRLCHLCVYLSDSLLRHSAEQLLAVLIEELYCTHAIVWPGGRDAILVEIEVLPSSYKEWPNTNGTIFFVLAYLLFLHSKLLWNHKVLWISLNNYITTYTAWAPQQILKALLMLYPLGIVTYGAHNGQRNSRILLESLGTCKSLAELLTYHPIQLTWLLRNAKTTVKKVVLVAWLCNQTEDTEIVGVLNSTKMGFLVIQLFLNYPDAYTSSRMLQLMVNLTPETNLEKAIERALPLVCTRPTIFGKFLQLKPAVPVDLDEVLYLIKVAAASLPFLDQNCAIQAACQYSIRLLDTMKHQPNALLMFCHYFTSVRFLVAKSGVVEDTTSLAAMKLLRRLVKNQETNNVKVGNKTTIQFASMLQGNSVRVSCGLKLLQSILNRGQHTVFLKIHNDALLDTYHFMHTLIRHEETAPAAYKVLRQLILYENNLSFSLTTLHTLCLLCNQDMGHKSMESFLMFLEEWLKVIIQYPYIYVPIDNLLIHFSEIGIDNDTGHRICQLLHKYKQRRL